MVESSSMLEVLRIIRRYVEKKTIKGIFKNKSYN